MNEKRYKYLFGPVPSRRMGQSLGVDLVPFKTCGFDCIFCQLGRTSNKTLERREYVPIEEVTAEFEDWLKSGNYADYITLSGSGEPTLNSDFGRLIDFVSEATDTPVALLTNGSLLGDSEVRKQLARLDLIKVSFSAWDQLSFEQVNRPHPGITFKRLIEGIRGFRQIYKGELWVEVFLLEAVNSGDNEVSRIAEMIKPLEPEKVHLNTVTRPPCEEYAHPLPEEKMGELVDLFEPSAEIIAEYKKERSPAVQATEDNVLDMLQRRPCTFEEICRVCGLHKNEAAKYVGKLIRKGWISQRRQSGALYYSGTK